MNYLNDSDTFVFVAARLKSKRLPKKALIEVGGRTILEHLINQLKTEISEKQIVVCTSTSKEDLPLVQFCKEKNFQVFCGAEEDVMGRFLGAANQYGARNIVRVTGDNPLTEPKMILHQLSMHIMAESDYTYTEDLPVGCRSEIIATKALVRIYEEIQDRDSTEYMTYILNRPDKLKVLKVKAFNSRLEYPDIFLTIDSLKDLKKFDLIVQEFGNFLDLEKIINWINACQTRSKIYKELPPTYSQKFNVKYIGE
jgi:spore coat polysaccharide biosynthesis protein SpsF